MGRRQRGKAAGTYVEKKVVNKYKSEGWISFRVNVSIRTYDIVSLKAGNKPRLIEVKSNVDGGPYKSFGPAKRKALKAAAKQAGAEAILAYWPPQSNLIEIPSSLWPVEDKIGKSNESFC